MRPGQNKQRMRGRGNNGRKGPNPLTRSFESNGPDVKIRGTAQHIAEKYLQLARDAQTSGDPVAAENYLQHAEHYFRLIAAAQLAQQQAVQGYVRSESEQEELEEDDDMGGLPDRFASPFERQVQPVMPVQQPQQQPQPGSAQPYLPDAPRYDQPRADMPREDQPRGEHYRGEGRPDYRGQNRGQDGRNQDRAERPYQGERGFNPQQQGGERQERQERSGQRDNRWQRDNRPQRHDRDNRPQREPYTPREPYAPREVAEQRFAPEAAAEAPVGLPAFITTPVRAPVVVEAEPVMAAPVPASVAPEQPAATEEAPKARRAPRRKRVSVEASGETPASEE